MLYDGWLINIAKRFQARFENEIKIVHNFEFGPEFEIAIAKTLRTILPSRYSVCRGFVVDQNGAEAGDDIIIFDSWRFPTLRALGDDLAVHEHVPAEAVVAYIEAKHTLKLDPRHRQSVHAACRQTGAVKMLLRERVPLGRIGGFNLSGGLTVTRAQGWPPYHNPWFTAIFARYLETPRNMPGEELWTALRIAGDEFTALPDLVAAERVVAFPVLPSRSPVAGAPAHVRCFLCDDTVLDIVHLQDDLAFGVAAAHLLWALENIQLGEIPWATMMLEPPASKNILPATSELEVRARRIPEACATTAESIEAWQRLAQADFR